MSWLHWAEYWFNTSFHTSTEHTPFELVYGRPPPVMVRWVQGETRVEAVQRDLVDRDEAIRQLKSHLHRAPNTTPRFNFNTKYNRMLINHIAKSNGKK